jgi:hypothetical protein
MRIPCRWLSATLFSGLARLPSLLPARTAYPGTVRQLINADLDIMLAVLAQALRARLPRRHPRHHAATVPRNPGQITTTGDVTLSR